MTTPSLRMKDSKTSLISLKERPSKGKVMWRRLRGTSKSRNKPLKHSTIITTIQRTTSSCNCKTKTLCYLTNSPKSTTVYVNSIRCIWWNANWDWKSPNHSTKESRILRKLWRSWGGTCMIRKSPFPLWLKNSKSTSNFSPISNSPCIKNSSITQASPRKMSHGKVSSPRYC